MIPASILLILLVCADLVSHVALWMRERHNDERVQDIVREAFMAEAGATVQVSEYKRDLGNVQYEIRRLRAWSKMPDEFKF